MHILFVDIDEELVEVKEYELDMCNTIERFHSEYKDDIQVPKFILTQSLSKSGLLSIYSGMGTLYLVDVTEKRLDNPPST